MIFSPFFNLFFAGFSQNLMKSVYFDPQVEAALQTSNFVDNIMVYADPYHNYCVALVVPLHQALENWAQGAGIKYSNFSELCEKSECINEVQKSLTKVRCVSNGRLSELIILYRFNSSCAFEVRSIS